MSAIRDPREKNPDAITEAEQQTILDGAKAAVKEQAFHMKRALDQQEMMNALKHASNMICELRTGLLTPKFYYELYMETFDQLRHLETYLMDEKHGKKMAELYELVQYAGNILPRLYLLITVGSAYIRLREAPAKDVLRDIGEMSRGVQHPTRGLFLRTYLSEATKDTLPDVGDEVERRSGTVQDSIEFVLQNFTEMNKLWVRMQWQVPAAFRAKREQERADLRLLVGKNIMRLSQLDGVDLPNYQSKVLPRLLEQIVGCRDVLAQQYLMECIIQAFPDDYHLRTLSNLLSACAKLSPGVNTKTILVQLINRLASFSERGEPIPDDVDVFEVFSRQVGEVVEAQKGVMPLEDVLELEASLLQLTMSVYRDKYGNVDQVFEFCASVCENSAADELRSKAVVSHLLKLLDMPLQQYKDVHVVLQLPHYSKLLAFLSWPDRRRVSLDIVSTARQAADSDADVSVRFFSTDDEVDSLLDLIEAVVLDQSDMPKEGELGSLDDEDMDEDQTAVASLVTMFDIPAPEGGAQENPADLEMVFAMYLAARKHFGQGGETRIKYVLPSLVFGACKLALRLARCGDERWVSKCKKLFKFTHETVTALLRCKHASIAFRLFLQCALSVNRLVVGAQEEERDAVRADLETLGYEFVAQSFAIYEEHISDSGEQVLLLHQLIGGLQEIVIFGSENYDTLVTKAALHSSKLLKKPDQCRAVYQCSHLFWGSVESGKQRDDKRVLECLQRALKIADGCVDTAQNVLLFLEILNQYLYYFEDGNPAVTAEYLNGLIELINTNIANVGSEGEVDAEVVTRQYRSTLDFINAKKAAGADIFEDVMP
jgi:vacuolar protein sorting-associated protein 35